jgi:choline kinase
MANVLLLMVGVFNRKFNIVILAAGMGKRLRPLTLANPKPLVLINGESILSRLLVSIPQENVKSMSIVIGYHGDMVERSVRKMNLPYCVKFFKNSNYINTHCASSLAIVEKLLPEGALLFNSDIVFSPGVLEDVIKRSNKNSFIVCKEANSHYDSDLQKIASTNGIIKQWKLELKEYTSEVIGPVHIDCSDGKVIQEYINKNRDLVDTLPCFTLLSKFMVNGKTSEITILQNDCFEIDTVEDLNNASLNLRSYKQINS